jgi:hypothetical protein
MIVHALEVDKDPFRPREDNEDVLCPEFPYLSSIGVLMYLENSAGPNIASVVNLLARHNVAPTMSLEWS